MTTKHQLTITQTWGTIKRQRKTKTDYHSPKLFPNHLKKIAICLN